MGSIAMKRVGIIILIQSLFCFISACRSDSGWGDAITRQVSQPGSMLGVDSLVVNFMEDYHIPGLSIAVSKDGKLLYAKGYGYSDIPSKEEVTRNSLFRVGQISQTITAIAIMKLIQEGKLSPGSKVFGDSGILEKNMAPIHIAPTSIILRSMNFFIMIVVVGQAGMTRSIIQNSGIRLLQGNNLSPGPWIISL